MNISSCEYESKFQEIIGSIDTELAKCESPSRAGTAVLRFPLPRNDFWMYSRLVERYKARGYLLGLSLDSRQNYYLITFRTSVAFINK